MDDHELDRLLQARHFEDASPDAAQCIIAKSKASQRRRAPLLLAGIACIALCVLTFLPHTTPHTSKPSITISDSELLNDTFFYPEDTLFL